MMKNGSIFEWSPVNIILDKQEDEEVFDNLINYLKNHHNCDYGSEYVPDNSDGDENSLGSREEEYATMDQEEIMIIRDDDVYEEGDISDNEYGSNTSEEEKNRKK